MLNKAGSLRYKIQMQYTIKSQSFEDWFYVTKLGDQKVILGLPWLRRINPRINWATGAIDFVNWKKNDTTIEDEHIESYIRQVHMETELLDDDEDELEEDLETDHLWIQSKLTAAQDFAQKHTTKEDKSMLPAEYHKWKEVFDKKASERFPSSCPWDHAIDLKEGFKLKIGKIYPLSVIEQELLDKWLNEQLAKGYIHPSQSSQASPFFFVPKKEKGEFRPCQDYRYVNSWTK